jgi:Bacterial PH domain
MRTQLNNGREYELEEQYGLPEKLPANERIEWQGSPSTWKIAKNILYIRPIIVYFSLITVYRVFEGVQADLAPKALLASGLWMLALSLLCVGLVYFLAYMTATTTVYTITNRRVVMRIGIALTKTFNLPFKAIVSADFSQDKDGYGDIPLKISAETKIAWIHLWPHARPGEFTHPQPMMRCIADAKKVSEILTIAWCAENQVQANSVNREAVAVNQSSSGKNLAPGLTNDLGLT